MIQLSIGALPMVLVRYSKMKHFLYKKPKEHQNGFQQIKEIINTDEPMAIMKYFEWPIFSNDYAKARYTLLRIDKKNNDIQELDIPLNVIPFVISKLVCFEEVIKLSEGIAWERMGFRDVVKGSVS